MRSPSRSWLQPQVSILLRPPGMSRGGTPVLAAEILGGRFNVPRPDTKVDSPTLQHRELSERLSTLLGDRCAALYFGPLTPSRLRPLRCRCDATRFTAQSRGRQSLLLSSCPGPIPVRPFRPSGPSGPNRYRTTSARPMFLSTRSALRSIHPVRLTRKSNAVNAASRPDRRGRGQAEQHMHVAARHSCCRGQRTPHARQSPCDQSRAPQA